MQYGLLHHRIHRRVRRSRVGARCLLITLTLAFLAASIGVLPSHRLIARQLGLAVGEAYPCAGGRCGCASTRECWTLCRCQSMAEKVAWAREHGAEVPAFADLGRLAFETPGEPACELCVSEVKSAGADEPTPTAPTPTAPTLTALGCKGLQSLMAVGVVIPIPDARVVGAGPARPPARGAPPAAERPESRTLDAPTPPPRSA